MGVAGLWDVLNKAGQSRSLTHLTVVDGFEKNSSARRAYRVGVDASIWYQHAIFSKGGENPELRLLFFRLRSLAELPLIPLFVFDGRERPKLKRGSRKGKAGSHGLTAGMKKLLDIFGMEWRMAFGEAEAELAYLNRLGVIDAIMTDDVDALVFGAQTIIKNPSLALSGNRSNPAVNLDGKPSKHHVMIVTADAIRNHPDVQLTRGGLVLCALLSGGDYDDGLNGFGINIAHGLARCGFGDQLLDAHQRRTHQDIRPALATWRIAVNAELRTNSRGFLRCKYPSLSLPDNFPSSTLLEAYTSPVCSARDGGRGGGALRDTGEMDLFKITAFVEDHFDEWGHRSAIIKRFRELMWGAAAMRVLRRAALEADEKEKDRRISAGREDLAIRGALEPSSRDAVGTSASLVKKYLSPAEVDRYAAAFVRRDPVPTVGANGSDGSHPLLSGIVGSRTHISTDNLLEYRVELDPHSLLMMVNSSIKGKHREPPEGAAAYGYRDEVEDMDSPPGSSQGAQGTPKKTPADPESVMRIWLPASIMRQVHPDMVEDFLAGEGGKQARKSGAPLKRKAVSQAASSDIEGGVPPTSSPAPPPRKHVKDAPTAVSQAGAPPARQSRAALPPRNLPHNAGTTEAVANQGYSLAVRRCGFHFTFPDPDDPDRLMLDHPDEEEPDPLLSLELERDVVAARPSKQPARVYEQGNPGPSSQARRQSRASVSSTTATPRSHPPVPILAAKPYSSTIAPTTSRPRVSASLAALAPGSDDETEADLGAGSLPQYNDMFDQILGIKGPGLSRTKKGKGPVARKRVRAPAAGAEALSHVRAAKRKRGAANAGVASSAASGVTRQPRQALPTTSSVPPRARATFPNLPSPPRATSSSRHLQAANSRRPSNAEPSKESTRSLSTPQMSHTSMAAASKAVTRPITGMGKSSRRWWHTEPTSSQDSGLGAEAFLSDVQRIFDHTQ